MHDLRPANSNSLVNNETGRMISLESGEAVGMITLQALNDLLPHLERPVPLERGSDLSRVFFGLISMLLGLENSVLIF